MGDAKAMLNLGVMYYRGKGTRKDYVLAHMWFGLAHQLGNQVGGDGPPTEKQASE
jgi:TPR repeat protein